MKTILTSAAILAVSTAAAFAGGTVPIPVSEPGTLGMFAAAAAVAIIGLRLWRK